MQDVWSVGTEPRSRLAADELRRFHAGDARQLSALVSQYTSRLRLDARRHASCAEDAEDLVQETWIRAYEKRASFRGDGSLYAWLRRVMVSAAGSRWRTERRRAHVLRHAPDAAVGGDRPAFDDVLDDEAEALHRGLRLIGALMRLSPRQREMVILRFMGAYSIEKIADAMGCAPGTVKATVSQAVKRLRKEMGVRGARAAR